MKAQIDALDTNYLCPKTVLSFDLYSLLERKGIAATLFDPINCTITLDAPISDHVAWVFRHIYSIPYPNQAINPEGISRCYHGIAHVSRAAMYAVIFANLYRRHGDVEALALTNEELKLIQIALLFHDSAREGDDEDLWDHESATFLYCYLTRILKLSTHTAKALAEAVANKDWVASEPYLVLFEMQGEVSWSLDKGEGFSRTIYHKLIHDSDCLDIIRARYVFKGKKLHFYQDIVCNYHSKSALNEFAELIIRARSLIEMQGDGSGRQKPNVKKLYDNENAYLTILQDISNGKYILFDALYANGVLLSSEQLATLVLIDENNLLNQQKILARGMITPTAIAPKNESFATLEFRKTKRRKGVLTNTSKANGLTKEGNPSRSVSLLGGSVFADVGGLLFTVNAKAIKAVYAVDADTGFGKKEASSMPTITLDALELKMKKGGAIRFFDESQYTATHNEIIYDIQAFDAIYYTYDPTFASAVFHGNPENTALYAPILKAIYLQLAYSKAFDGIVLPIYEYSGIHHYLKKVEPFTDTQISDMWEALCKNFMIGLIEKGAIKKLNAYSINDIMVYSLYKKLKSTELYDGVANGCDYYPKPLTCEIEKRISEAREVLIRANQQKVKSALIKCLKTLYSSAELTDELSKQLVQNFKLSLPSAQIITIVHSEIKTIIKEKLIAMFSNKQLVSRNNLFHLIIIACGLGLVSDFKKELSRLDDCRWITYNDPNIDWDKSMFLSDLILLLNSFCADSGKIDLSYLTVFEISNGSKSQFIFLNEAARNYNYLQKFFTYTGDVQPQAVNWSP